jgi:hypothetical protein
MTPQSALADCYLQFLRDRMGLEARVDTHQNVELTWDGWTMFVENTAPSDPEFFHLVCLIGAEHSSSELATVAVELAGKRKLIKARPVERGLMLSVELLMGADGCLPYPGHLSCVVPRALRVLADASKAACEHLAFLDATRELGRSLHAEAEQAGGEPPSADHA